MPVKAFILPTQELQEAVQNILEKQGTKVTSIEITVVEEKDSCEDVAIVNIDGKEEVKTIKSLIPSLNELFSIDIKSYEGFDYPEFAGQTGGYVFLIN